MGTNWAHIISPIVETTTDKVVTCQRIFPVCRRCIGVECYLCRMKPTQHLCAILPDVLIDNFEVDHFEKTDTRFDIWLDEKKVQMREDKNNTSVISYGFGDYHTI